MTLQSAMDTILSDGGVILVSMTIIQITPIKINTCSYLSKKIGMAINGELICIIDKLDKGGGARP